MTFSKNCFWFVFSNKKVIRTSKEITVLFNNFGIVLALQLNSIQFISTPGENFGS